MAIICRPSVLPGVPFGCDCGTSDSFINVQDGDISQVQFELTSLTENLITNGNFVSATGWSVGADWSIASGVATAAGTGVESFLSKTLTDDLTEGYYLVQFDLTASATALGLNVYLGDQLIPAGLVGTMAGSYVGVHTFKLYRYITTFGSHTIKFGLLDGDFEMDNVIIQKMSSISVDILDCATGTLVETFDPDNAMIEYYSANPLTLTVLNSGPVEYSIGYAQVNFDWQNLGIGTGCYQVCFRDAGLLDIEKIVNGKFTSSANWTIINTDGVGWAIAGGLAEHDASGAAGADVIQQTLESALTAGCDYTLEFDYDGIGGHLITVLYDTATLTNQTLTTFATDNTPHTASVAIPAEVTVIKFSVPARGGLSNTTIDNVSIRLSDLDCVECSCESMCISFKLSHDVGDMCNILLKASNENNALGYDFVNFDFEHRLRVFGKLRNARYDFPDEVTYKKSNGVTDLVSTGYEKFTELQIFQIPEGLHDILSLMLIHQNFSITIDGEEMDYVKRPGSMSPIWNKYIPDAPVIIEILPKVQKYYNHLV